MKKILIARDLYALLERTRTFLNRTDVAVFMAATSDEALAIHRSEHADLIITHLDLPGIGCEQFCSLIREDEGLRAVSIILVCTNTAAGIDQSAQCRVNAVLLKPVHPLVLTVKAQQLLAIAARETLRVVVNASIESRSGDETFFCRSRNISATGMLIETDKLRAEGKRLTCLFHLPNAKKVEVTGTIVRVQQQTPGFGYHYGVMFTDILPETRQVLIDFVGHVLNRLQTVPQ